MSIHDAAIVGFAETKIVDKSTRDVWELGAEILEKLLDGAGIEKDEIDGLILSSSSTAAGDIFWSQHTAEQLGLEVGFAQTLDIGGCAPLGAVARAAMAIEAGLCSTVMCLFADTPAAENNQKPRCFIEEWQTPLGYIGPVVAFGLISQRYEHQFGLDYSQLAKLAVAQRGHSVLNDMALEKLRKPITVDDYLSSRLIAEPVRLLDCVMRCDGATGILVTGRKMAEKKGYKKMAVPVGYGEHTGYGNGKSIVDMTESGHKLVGEKVFRQSGLTPKDIGSFHPYDDFIIAVMMQMEMLGFCGHGQGSAFIREHDFNHNGDLPLNTGGGQISAGQCGLAGGGTNLIEAVRQLFGEGGTRQVRNTSNALVTGIGGIPYGRNWNTSAAMVLTSNA